MSYPRCIKTLIIEDDPDVKDTYEVMLRNLRKNLPIEYPQFAFSRADAENALKDVRIYHLVILDLSLPKSRNNPASENVSHGMEILRKCKERDQLPIPGLVIISGHLDKTQQTDLENSVRNGFAYGRVLTKGESGSRLERELKIASEAVLRYLDIGIHLRDSGKATFPILLPRDEDLVRRSVLEQEEKLGVDLEWWSADYTRGTVNFSKFPEWTKVLVGHYLLKNMEISLPVFFKVGPGTDGRYVIQDAERLSQRLSHINIVSSIQGENRFLLVTRNVTGRNDRPISFSQWVVKDETDREYLPGIAESVADQIFSLGGFTPDQIPISGMVWQHHQLENLKVQFDVHFPNKAEPDEIAKDLTIGLFERISECDLRMEVNVQGLRHGDLNCTNIAISPDSPPFAFIFDAGGSVPGVTIDDLAGLEISSILHLGPNSDQSLLEQCTSLYSGGVRLPDPPYGFCTTDLGRKIVCFISHLRKYALQRASCEVYCLAVFDHSMRQLGGLKWSPNKIQYPNVAAKLSYVVAKWVFRNVYGSCQDPRFERTATDS